MTRTPPHVLIVGGGAGGLELAIRLSRLTGRGRLARVTLLDRRPSHIWKPRLHEIAVGLLLPAEEQASYADQARQHGFEFVLGELSALDHAARTASVAAVPVPRDLIHTAEDEPLIPARTIRYDTAVLAVGSTVNDFGIPGVAEHCYALDSAPQAERLHRAFLAAGARVAAGVAKTVRVAIVGAGTTGVELAGELRAAAVRLGQYRSLLSPDQLEVTLLEMADRPLPGTDPGLSDDARRVLDAQGVAMIFDAKVAAVHADALELADGRRIAADLFVWASGVRGPALVDTIADVVVERGHRIRTDSTLRAARPGGGVHNALFVLGDCGACFEPGADKPDGATAQVAHQQARLLARSLAGCLRGRPPLPFRYRYRGTLVSLGERSATGDLPAWRKRGKPVRIGGVPAKLAYQALYRGHLVELFGVWRTAALTLGGWLRHSAMPAVKLHWE